MKPASAAALSILLTICLSLTSCGQKDNGAAQAGSTSVSAQPPSVEVTTVKSQKLNTTERLPAELTPYESVDVFAKETGFVKSIKVDRGSKVKQGELIAELEAPELVAQRAQAEAAYQSAEAQFAAGQAKLAADRGTYQNMSAAAKTPGVVAPNDLDIAQKTVQSDEANVGALGMSADAAQENLKAVAQLESYLNITAPFAGQVTTRYVHPGALIGPAGGPGAMTPIVKIETTTRHRLVVPVPENDVEGVPEGTIVNFTVPSFPGRTFHAPIARISHDVDTKTRTMPVELDVKDPKAELVPGTFCQIEWPIRRTYPTLFVPVSAVANDLQRTFVIRVRTNRTEWVDVQTGARVGDLVEVFGKLDPGDLIAIRGTDQLRNGAEVSPKPANPSQ
jgi:membrane fusion protein, multidrug efflux system